MNSFHVTYIGRSESEHCLAPRVVGLEKVERVTAPHINPCYVLKMAGSLLRIINLILAMGFVFDGDTRYSHNDLDRAALCLIRLLSHFHLHFCSGRRSRVHEVNRRPRPVVCRFSSIHCGSTCRGVGGARAPRAAGRGGSGRGEIRPRLHHHRPGTLATKW